MPSNRRGRLAFARQGSGFGPEARMTLARVLRRGVAGLLLAGAAGAFPASAQPAAGYQPQVGQEGKDVVWVPTAQGLVDRMLDMAKAKPGDYVIDLGSGD